MSIARDMKEYMLQEKVFSRGASGSKNSAWKNVQVIRVAIYKNSEKILSVSERYNDLTHTGLTYYKGIKAGKNRLISGSTVYQITSCNTEHRLTNLLLKEVDTDV